MYDSNIISVVIVELVKILIVGLFTSLIGAVVLRAAAHWVVKLDVPFGRAYWTAYISFLANSMLGLFLGFMVGYATGSEEAVDALRFILLPVGFIVLSGIVSLRLNLSFRKACLVSITMIGIGFGIAFVIVLIVLLLTQVTDSW